MSVGYGQVGYPIGSANISTVNLTSATLISSGYEGSFESWTFNMQNVSCGSTGVNLIIDDSTIPFEWTGIAWKTWIGFRSACWGFADVNGQYGTGNHNILPWNATFDKVSRPKNCWELPQYTLKMSTCDNNADNFVHQSYATGSFRHWNMVRRRDGTLPAGPAAGFACTAGGALIISQIMVFR
jgi:hypothetical protein